MLRHFVLGLFLAVSADSLFAQQAAPAPASPDRIQLPAGTLPYDPATFAAAVQGSYYHPDQLTAINCNVSIDWAALFGALQQAPQPDRLKTLQGLKVSSRAMRGKPTELAFDWTEGTVETKDQMENGLKQMVGGFYQMYWPMIATSPIQKADEIQKIEPQPEGGVKAYLTNQGIKVVAAVNKENLPTHYDMDSAAMTGTIDPHYIASPVPVPGDLHRMSGLEVSEHIGTSTLNVTVNLDYQQTEGFYIPKHVRFNVAGAYSIAMDFSACSTSKSATPEQK